MVHVLQVFLEDGDVDDFARDDVRVVEGVDNNFRLA